ncbi:RNA polymerase sigma factor [Fulvivirga kasyanovii]|uniref:RNA polymerase sigma factor n=1 Tax=Fulvivirga kasyanovii TaxID=396812 RepID=A0ABW9RXG9_9BACT|nr:RNA polymerase sigma factor [Fulvivirga kasyanovii]MTI28937.1 RNA polymerase sigma factor [Fulvivirga kasyanovii]
MGEKFQNIHADVIARCLQGDRYAQSQLYKLYSKAMFNVCYRMTNNFDDAEDVLQEAFISAFKNLQSYKGDAAFGAWLKRIVINKAINFIRKKQVEFAEVQDNIADEEPAPVEYSSAMMDIDRIKRAMTQLPDGYRLVFSLYLIEGYDHSEIAQILGITESTSKSQFNRSKKKLKEILQKEVIYE